MKELIIKVLKTYLPYFNPETLEQIADDILEIRPANPIDAVKVLNRYCGTSSCNNCHFMTPFGCGFKINTIPIDWHVDDLRSNDNE